VIFEYGDGSRRFNVEFGSNAEGDPIVLLATGVAAGFFTGPSATIVGNGYHLYELIFDPAAASADLFVDGLEVLSDYAGHTIGSTTRIAWGALSTPGTGGGNYSLVEWEVLESQAPEPMTFSLLGAGLLGLGLAARRRRRP
jgi:large repetitive protein